jgi:hypothetical protein
LESVTAAVRVRKGEERTLVESPQEEIHGVETPDRPHDQIGQLLDLQN